MATKKLFLTQVYEGPLMEDGQVVGSRYRYTVSKVIGSTSPAINEMLDKDRVDDYCDDVDWTITII